MDEPTRTHETPRRPPRRARKEHVRREKTPLTVLFVGDTAAMAEASLEVLAKGGFEVDHRLARTMPELEAALAEEPFDVIVLDQAADGVPVRDILGYVEMLDCDIPLFVVAEDIDAASTVEAMTLGAKDYVLTRSLFRLPASIARELKAVELRDRQREAVRLNRALGEIHTLIHSTFDADEVLQRALDKACEVLRADNGAIQLRESDRWVIRYQHGLGDDHRGESFSDEQMYVLPQILEHMAPLVMDDLQADERYDHEVFDPYDVNSTLAVPVALRGELIGLIFVNKACSPSGFTAEAVDFGAKLGAAISLAVDNVDMVEREREYARFTDTLSRIIEILLAPFDPVSTMRRVVAQARELFDADSARIIERAGDEWVFAHVIGDRAVSSLGGGASEDALVELRPSLERAESVFIEDGSGMPGSPPPRYSASIALPLTVRDQVVAVLSLDFRRPRAFSARDREFAERLRSAVSLALENEERLREESSIATLTDTLEHAEAGIYGAPDEEGVVSLVLKTATVALGATGASAIWCRSGEITSAPLVPRIASVDLDSAASRSAFTHLACGTGGARRNRVTAEVLPATCPGCELIAVRLPSVSDAVALVIERQGGEFRFRKEELSFAERLGEVAGIALENLRLARERQRLASTREEWLAGISHDLRAPVAALRGYAGLLGAPEERSPAFVREQSQRILEQADRIERMIADLLLAFRIRANALPVSSQTVHLRPLLEDVRRTVLGDRRAHGRRVQVDAASDITVLADPALLERAITNLAMNAIVHNPAAAMVSLWTSERDGLGIVQVSDDGRGIDAATISDLFERSRRSHGSAVGSSGAGLGLPIARQVVEAMGGTLEIESAVGAGTTATIALPLAPR